MDIKHTFVVLAYKESDKLEDCIKSVLNQKYKSHVVIATSTPNAFIDEMAKKYNLEVIVNKNHKNIGGDFDFATNCVESDLVTVAHQDDIYDFDYSNLMVEAYQKYKKSLIIFSDYYEIRNGINIYSNKNLKIKRILLLPLRIKKISSLKFIKRSALRFGNAISCPAVTFAQKNVPACKFSCDLTCDVDWYAWEKLSKLKGNFIFVPRKAMGHTISEETTTTEIINAGIRTKEDYEILKKFWPDFIARLINRFYAGAEKSNDV